MVDFSLQVSEMLKLNSQRNLIWIDHHKCVIEAMDAAGASIKAEGQWARRSANLHGNTFIPISPCLAS